MHPDKKQQLECIFGSSLSDDDQILLNESKEFSEIEKAVMLADWLDNQEQRNIEQITRHVRRLNNYLVDQIVAENLNEQQALSSKNDKKHQNLYTLEIETDRICLKERFLIWLIERLHWLPARDEIVFPGQSSTRKAYSHSSYWRIIATVSLLLFIVIYFLSPQLSSKVAPTLPPPIYEQVSTKDVPQLINYSANVRIAMAQQTQIHRITDTHTALRTGSIWLDVQKGGAGFNVSTDYGEVRVTGTSFGVSRLSDPDCYRIDCSEGSVQIIANGNLDTLTAGKYIILNRNGFKMEGLRKLGRKKARWVRVMEREQAIQSIDGLVAYWNMDSVDNDELELTVLDEGPYGYHAFADSEEGMEPRLRFAPSVQSKIFRDALKIEKEDQSWLTIHNPEKISALKDDFTLMAWVRIEGDIKDSYRILGCYDLLYGVHFGFEKSTINLDLGGSNRGAGAFSPKMLIANQWIHVAVSWSKTEETARFYADGKFIGEKIIEIERQYKLMDWYIGRNRRFMNEEIRGSKPYYFHGLIDEVRIYDQVLTEAEIRAISMIDFIQEGANE